jgi:glycosyltransferase involved in cell wall biosynthesis
MIPEFLNTAHGWTTTTPELAKLYYQHNRNPVIIDNFIDYSFRDWGVSVDWEEGKPIFTPQPLKRPAEWGDRVVIGYAGGNTHQADLELIGPEIRSVLKRNPQAMLAFYSSHQLGQWFAKKFQIPDDQIYFVPARHFMDYPVGLQGFDIALAPIECNQFNLCKSSLRCYEYAAVGAAIVASNVGPYAWFQARHPESALLVGNSPKTFSTWSEAIQLLIDNPELRRTMQSANRQLMIDHYSLERNVWRWPMAWAAIAEQRNAGNLGPDPERREKNWYMSYGKAGVHDLCPCHSGQKYSECHKGAWG